MYIWWVFDAILAKRKKPQGVVVIQAPEAVVYDPLLSQSAVLVSWLSMNDLSSCCWS